MYRCGDQLTSLCVQYHLSYGFYSLFVFFSSRRRHTRSDRDWSSDVCSSDLTMNGFDAPSDREIGILRSLGASKPFIVSMIFQEATFICVLGVVLGIGTSFLIERKIGRASCRERV